MSSTDDLKNKGKKPSADSAKPPAGSAKPHWKTATNHLGDLVSGVLSDVVARRSGMTLDLIAAWGDIAGPDYAHCTKAEKITWPRRSSDIEPFQPGVLTVACDDAKAIYFQHETTQILERLNFFFGFQAIAKIRIVQKPVNLPKKSTRQLPDRLSPEEETRLAAMLDKIDDPPLRKRLEKFGRAVIYSNSK